ncbi:O-antigen ligase family protein [Paenactinomyces guangxiensis]|uniref:O-antigen ligase family protein n=1 Tax=Paenactinomyces guangxiensis TaxID=1490290 RepID=A0A7W1WSY4_9BACL|nr:O-antigen ligase family protein [Paenactinomyces guangxiensis]MBA4495474.1 O-antigen ligase family protein [Paenactinomyces guangxiensis]MBH8592403.1 O-antigen ligase family protein [Paenactinomyces guangxiensis]
MTLLIYRGKWKFKGWPEGIFVAFFFLTLVSWFFNPAWFYWIPVGVIPLITFSLFFLLTYWIRNIVGWSWQEVQKIYLQFWLGGIYVAAIVIIQQVDWPVINDSWIGSIIHFYNEFRWQAESSVRSVGTSGNSNLAAALLICFALLSIYSLSVLTQVWQRIAALGAFLLYCTAIWCTGSRGAWVGLVMGLIVQVWMTGHRKRTVALVSLFIILVTFFPEAIPRKDTLANTIEVRFKVWSTSLDIFREHWLLGTLPLHFGQIFSKKAGVYVYHAHNVFLGIATEFGVVGLALFLALVITTVRRARRWRKTANCKKEKRLAGMLISQTIALLGHSMYDYPIVSPQVGLLFMLSVIVIHTQYERRCLSRPKWSEQENGEPGNIPYSSVSSLFFFMKNYVRNTISQWLLTYKKRA